MPYAIGGFLVLAGVVCIGIAYNNNGYILFRAWGALYQQQQKDYAAAIQTATAQASTTHPTGVTSAQAQTVKNA